MSGEGKLCHLSGWARRWVRATISDNDIEHALADENLERTVIWAGTPWRERVYFFLTCSQIERTIEHLNDLEKRRVSGDLANPDGFHVDNWTFTKATKQLGKVLGECREAPNSTT
jgi:hypothetical protein